MQFIAKTIFERRRYLFIINPFLLQTLAKADMYMQPTFDNRSCHPAAHYQQRGSDFRSLCNASFRLELLFAVSRLAVSIARDRESERGSRFANVKK